MRKFIPKGEIVMELYKAQAIRLFCNAGLSKSGAMKLYQKIRAYEHCFLLMVATAVRGWFHRNSFAQSEDDVMSIQAECDNLRDEILASGIVTGESTKFLEGVTLCSFYLTDENGAKRLV
jgi:hypothetical protein